MIKLRSWLVVLLFALGCIAGAQPAQAPGIAEIVGKHPIKMFSTLSSLFEAAGMQKILAGDKNYTLLAPDNAAFAKLPKAVMKKLMADPGLLKKLLSYYLIPGVWDVEKQEKGGWFVNGKTLGAGKHPLKTLGGEAVTMSIDRRGVAFDGVISPRDIGPWHLTNGRIYQLTSVIMPKKLAAELGLRAPPG